MPLKLSCREVIELNEDGEEEVKSQAVKNAFGYVFNVMKNIKKISVMYWFYFMDIIKPLSTFTH
ncbi:hypothetical protein [Domibacillus tundrae]|uniref:hypothetical protein n=1 Tax=Domibacillus tundrae TaxID=1587527 RepID=UPI00339A2DC4